MSTVMGTRASQRKARPADAQQGHTSNETSFSTQSSRGSRSHRQCTSIGMDKTARPSDRSKGKREGAGRNEGSSQGIQLPNTEQMQEQLSRIVESREPRLQLPALTGAWQSSGESISPESEKRRSSRRQDKVNTYEESDPEDNEKDTDFDSTQPDGKIGSKPEKGGKLEIPKLTRIKDDKELLEAERLSQQIASQISADNEKSRRDSQGLNTVPEQVHASMQRCPFCREPLTKKWAANSDLRTLMQHWLDRYHEAEGELGATATAAMCSLHRSLREVIPEGRRKMWPQTLDVAALRDRVIDDPVFLQQMRQRIENPDSSEWFRTIKARRLEFGRQFEGGLAQLAHADDMHAGYYGEVGYEALYEILVEEYLSAGKDIAYSLQHLANKSDCTFAPLSAQDFLSKVLLPELVCMLIQEDEAGRRRKRISMAEAKAIRDSSQRYGTAMFPISDLFETDDLYDKGSQGSSIAFHASGSESSAPTSSQVKSKGRSTNKSLSCTQAHQLPEGFPASSQVRERSKKRKGIETEASFKSCAKSPNRPRPRPSSGKGDSVDPFQLDFELPAQQGTSMRRSFDFNATIRGCTSVKHEI